MTRQELVNAKKSAQRIRIVTLNSLRSESLTSREYGLQMKTLELAHEQIKQASLAIDLLDLNAALK